MNKLFIIFLLAFTSTVNAGYITFTDRDAWRAAAGGGTGDLSEDFNSFTGTTVYGNPTGASAGFLNFATVSGNYSADPSWSIGDGIGGGAYAVDSTSYVILASYASGAGDTLITHSDVMAIGFDFRSPSSSNNYANPLTLTTSLFDDITGPEIIGSSSGFFGILYTSGEVFNSIRIRDLTDNRTFFGADNFEAYVAVETVPIPATVWLFGSGLIGLIAVARRKVRV